MQVRRGFAENCLMADKFMADKLVALAKALQTRLLELLKIREVPIFQYKWYFCFLLYKIFNCFKFNATCTRFNRQEKTD